MFDTFYFWKKIIKRILLCYGNFLKNMLTCTISFSNLLFYVFQQWSLPTNEDNGDRSAPAHHVPTSIADPPQSTFWSSADISSSLDSVLPTNNIDIVSIEELSGEIVIEILEFPAPDLVEEEGTAQIQPRIDSGGRFWNDTEMLSVVLLTLLKACISCHPQYLPPLVPLMVMTQTITIWKGRVVRR